MDICVAAGDEDGLGGHVAELDAIRAEVRELALNFPVPGIEK